MDEYFRPKFNWSAYVRASPDLARIKNEAAAWKHWCTYGFRENRVGAFPTAQLCARYSECAHLNIHAYAAAHGIPATRTGVHRHFLRGRGAPAAPDSIAPPAPASSGPAPASSGAAPAPAAPAGGPEPTVLVVLPTYNRSGLLRGVMEAMAAQTFARWTLLLIDDGSDADHRAEFRALKDANQDSRMVFMENPRNLGVAATLNVGVRWLSEWVEYTHFTWISDDNEYLPSFLEVLVADNPYFKHSAFHVSVQGGLTLNYAQYTCIDDVLDHFRGCAAFMWSRAAVARIGLYNEAPEYAGCEDYEYLLRTFRYTGPFAYSSEATMVYAQRPSPGRPAHLPAIKAEYEVVRRRANRTVTIVTSYFNRREQTLRTLAGFRQYAGKYRLDVIIVDDASSPDQRLREADVADLGVPVRVIQISEAEKGSRMSPCVPFNRGFAEATGDIVILQNPECAHIGDVVGHAIEHSAPGKYLAYSCFSANSPELTARLMASDAPLDLIRDPDFVRANRDVEPGEQLTWYNHPTYPTCYHFCAAIDRRKLALMNGFDVRFADGFCFDDDEFIHRIRHNLKLDVECVPADQVCVVHQHHARNTVDFKTNDKLKHRWDLNNATMGVYRNAAAFRYPKILHTYWDGNPMSYMNYLTYVSFIKHHPDWTVVLHTPVARFGEITWTTDEQKEAYSGPDYFCKLKLHPGVTVNYVDFEDIGFSNDVAEVIKSDYLRYYMLYTHGGVWSDTDILYVAPIESKLANIDRDAVMFKCSYTGGKSVYYPIGFFCSVAGSEMFRTLVDAANAYYNPAHYQCIGASMISDLIGRGRLPVGACAFLDNTYYLPFHFNQLDAIFVDAARPLPVTTFGVHWFNGAKAAKQFQTSLAGRMEAPLEPACAMDEWVAPYCNHKEYFSNRRVHVPTVSVVMSYAARLPQLMHTLSTIYQSSVANVEVVIFDDSVDADDRRGLTSVLAAFSKRIIKLVRFRHPKNFINPCVAYNEAIRHASGDILMIQNPEVCHVGDCIRYAVDHLTERSWLTFNCVGLSSAAQNAALRWMTADETHEFVTSGDGRVGGNAYLKSDAGGVLNSPDHFVAYHYCGAIFRRDLEAHLGGGFCEQYRNGLCYDDDDFVKRLVHAEFDMLLPDFSPGAPFVVHQQHPTVGQYSPAEVRALHDVNRRVFEARCAEIGFSSTVDIRQAPENETPLSRRVVPGRRAWHLAKIPKRLFVYWGGQKLPYLRYLTITTFLKYNPGWEVVVVVPKVLSSVCVWPGKQFEKRSLDYADYMPRVRDLHVNNRLVIEEFDFESIGISNDINEVHKSDFVRYHLLHTRGGVWSDMDIIYYRPLDRLSVNRRGSEAVEAVVKYKAPTDAEIGIDEHAIGFLMGAPGNAFFADVFAKARENYRAAVYQGIGPDLLNEYFPVTPALRTQYNLACITKSDMYCLDHNTASLFRRFDANPFDEAFINRSVGIHWYGGHTDFKDVLLGVNGNNVGSYPNLGFVLQTVNRVQVGATEDRVEEDANVISVIVIATNLRRRFYTMAATLESLNAAARGVANELVLSIDLLSGYPAAEVMGQEEMVKFLTENEIVDAENIHFKRASGMIPNQCNAAGLARGNILIYAEDDIVVKEFPSRKSIVELTADGVIMYNRHLSYPHAPSECTPDAFLTCNEDTFYLKDKSKFDADYASYAAGENLSVTFPCAIMRRSVFDKVYTVVRTLPFPFSIEAAFSHVVNTSALKSYVFCRSAAIPLDAPWLYRDNCPELTVAGETINRGMSRLALLTKYDVDRYLARTGARPAATQMPAPPKGGILATQAAFDNLYLTYGSRRVSQGLFDEFNARMLAPGGAFVSRVGGSDFNFMHSYLYKKVGRELDILKEFNGYFDNSPDPEVRARNVARFVEVCIQALRTSTFQSFVEFIDLFVDKSLHAISPATWDALLDRLFTPEDCIFDYNSTICNPCFFVASMNAWAPGKKILVVSPFSATVRAQYRRRGELHEGMSLPEFDLLTYTTPITYNCGEAVAHAGADNWFDQCDLMFDDIRKLDFDIALLSCGSYANVLGSRICTDLGRKSVYIGGALNLLFNIRGARYHSALWAPVQKYLNPATQVEAEERSVVQGLRAGRSIPNEGLNAYF